jgi:hypothetical protein
LTTACQTVPASDESQADDERSNAPAVARQTSYALFPGWENRPMPGKRWAPFETVEQDGRPGLQVKAQSSLSILSKRLRPGATASTNVNANTPLQLNFSWWVERLLPHANLSDPEASDSPARLAVSFEGDRSRFTPRDHMMSELLQLMTGDPLPYATLVYVWANDLAPGTIVPSSRTQRIRYFVVEQGSQRLGRWVNHRRDVRADFVKAFGESPGPVSGLALMTDTDNTRTATRAVYGPVSLQTN